MEQKRSEVASSVYGDDKSCLMFNAVASLLSRQQGNSEQISSLTAPLLVLTNMPGKDSFLANVMMGTSHSKHNGITKCDPSSCKEAIVPSFEQVHALATANLVASTQRVIAKQLAEESLHAKQPSTVKASDKRLCKQVKRENTDNQKNIQSDPSVCNEEFEPRPLTCSFGGCNRKFAWLNHLKYHELTHTNNRQYKCPYESCSKTFFTAQRLNVHRLTHTGEKPFQCNHQGCGKTFTTAGNLKNHHRIHTGEQPFVCDVPDCNRRFTEQSSLRKHKLTHSGDKPFECDICYKKFTQSGSRRQHLIRHHLDEELRNSFKQESKGTNTFDNGQVGQVTKNGQEKSAPQVLVLKNSYEGLSHDRLEDDKIGELAVPIYHPTEQNTDIPIYHPTEQNTDIPIYHPTEQNTDIPIYHPTEQNTDIPIYHPTEQNTDIPIYHPTEQNTDIPIYHPTEQNTDIPIYHPTEQNTDIPIYHPTEQNTDIPIYTTMEQNVDMPIYDPREHQANLPIYHSTEQSGDMSIYNPAAHPNDIVYGSDILDHEEVTHADYVSSHADYSVEITETNYSHHSGDITHSDGYNSPELSHREPDEQEISVSGYVPTEDEPSYNTCTVTKPDLSGSNSHVAHAQQRASNPAANRLCADRVDPETSATADHSDFPKQDVGHMGVTPFISGLPENSGVGSHTLGQNPGDRDMDPMMECDDDP